MNRNSVDKRIGPAGAAFVTATNAPDWATNDTGDGPEWTELPGGWVKFSVDDFPNHEVSVLVDAADPDRPVIAGLRIEPTVRGTFPRVTARSLSKLSLPGMARFARDTARMNIPGIVESHSGMRRVLKPSDFELRQVMKRAQASGETPARAVMAEFQVARPTAYKWLKGL